MPVKRGNSMIRGSGHGYHGNKAKQGSMIRRRSKVDPAVEEEAVFDMILLEKLNEESIVANITHMYMEDHIYIYIGNVVISVNPFRNLPDFYDDAAIERYRGRSAFDPKLPPHVFALADNVFSDLKYRGRDQVIIISGESGAGKTEASKKVMQYVAAVSGSSEKVNQVKEKLLATNPVLEAFGNAKTTRNDNSSRFGKYMDIQFNYQGDPCGGHITTYLLEKARVIGQGPGERNFHIFYQLLASGKGGSLGLKSDPMAYNLLKQGGEPKVKGMNDATWFKEVEDGLKFSEFTAAEQGQVWSALATILMLGEVTFKAAGSGSALDACPAELEKAMGASKVDIENGLTHNTVVVGGELTAADLNPAQASNSRDTLCKALYQRIFQWIADRVNSQLTVPKKDTKAVIGVLDIYGFEIFTKNGFEQFCINYCNEKLQQLFIELTLKTEQDEYVAEGVEWTPIEYFNNKVICDLVDAKTGGIVRTLDDECVRPGDKSDASWLASMAASKAGSHAHIAIAKGASDKSVPQDAFVIKHYAGDVTYTVTGFLDKNTDTLFKDLARLMFSSGNSVLKSCFPEGDESTWAGASKRPLTAGRLFVNSMNEMIDILNTKVPSYIRCIKPNHTKSPKTIDDDLFKHQIKYLGLLENVRVRRAGYCFRETYKDFFWRYRMLSEKTYPHWEGSEKDGAVEVMNSLAINPKSYQLGKTKLFIKSPKDVFRLEEERDEMMDKIANKLQRGWRSYLVRKNIGGWFKKMKEQFAPVEKLDGNNPTYGFCPSKTVFPPASASLKPMSGFLKGVYSSWWARKMITPLAPEKKDLMRTQLNAHNLLGGGQKAGFSLKNCKFTSHYAPDSEPAGAKAGFEAAVGAPVLWSDAVQKINRGSKVEERIFVLTKDNLYLTKGWKVAPKRILPIGSITAMITSDVADTVVIVKAATGDWVLNLNPGTMGELVARFGGSFKSCGGTFALKKRPLIANITGKPGKEQQIMLVANPGGSTERSTWSKPTKGFLY